MTGFVPAGDGAYRVVSLRSIPGYRLVGLLTRLNRSGKFIVNEQAAEDPV